MSQIEGLTPERDGFANLRDLVRESSEAKRLPDPGVRRALREQAGISQRAMADAVGVSKTALLRYERGEMRPRGKHLDRYVEALRLLQEIGA